MHVQLSPELEGKLNRIAAEQGKNSELLVCEAVERLVGYDEWFAAKSKRVSPLPIGASSSRTPMLLP